jgi:hypothetical protein
MKRFSKTAILFLLCAIIISCKDFQSNNLPFNQNDWKNADVRVRGRMYRSLLSQNILIGKKRNEIIEILGKPNEEGDFSGTDEKNKNYLKYEIDLGTFLEGKIQRNFLMIIFDKSTEKVDKTIVIDS